MYQSGFREAEPVEIIYTIYMLHNVCMHVCTYIQTRVEQGMVSILPAAHLLPCPVHYRPWTGNVVQGLGVPTLNIHIHVFGRERAHAVTSTIPPLSVTQGQPSLVSRKWPKGSGYQEGGSLRTSQEALPHFPADLPLGPELGT